MSNYEKKCFPICADADDSPTFIDPITHGNISVVIDATNKKTFNKMFNIKEGSRNMPSEEYTKK